MAEPKEYEPKNVSLNIKVQFQLRFNYGGVCVSWQLVAVEGNLKGSFF